MKKVFIRSGIRFDYVLADKRDAFLRELVQHHVSGQLKVAPEHVSDASSVQKWASQKTPFTRQFAARYFGPEPAARHLKQYLVPYLMSSHPGSTLREAVELAEYRPGPGLYAGAGPGFLSHPLYALHGDVLHRPGPPDHGAGVCTPQPP